MSAFVAIYCALRVFHSSETASSTALTTCNFPSNFQILPPPRHHRCPRLPQYYSITVFSTPNQRQGIKKEQWPQQPPANPPPPPPDPPPTQILPCSLLYHIRTTPIAPLIVSPKSSLKPSFTLSSHPNNTHFNLQLRRSIQSQFKTHFLATLGQPIPFNCTPILSFTTFSQTFHPTCLRPPSLLVSNNTNPVQIHQHFSRSLITLHLCLKPPPHLTFALHASFTPPHPHPPSSPHFPSHHSPSQLSPPPSPPLQPLPLLLPHPRHKASSCTLSPHHKPP